MKNNEGSSSIFHHHPPSSFSSTFDDSNNRSSKSLRLQNTLAELEWKIDKILEVVEDNGDTFAQRAQMYYQKRPELIEMLGDLRKSYRALADKVVTIRSESIPAPTSYFCSSSTYNYNHHSVGDHLMIFDHKPFSHYYSTASHLCHDFSDDIAHRHRHSRRFSDELVLFTDQQNNRGKNKNYSYDNGSAGEEKVTLSDGINPCEGEKGGGGWDELLAQVTELVEENTNKQAELIRRYAKKNEDMKLLVKENRRLRELLSDTEINDSNKQTSSSQTRWNPRHFFRKLLP